MYWIGKKAYTTSVADFMNTLSNKQANTKRMGPIEGGNLQDSQSNVIDVSQK